MKKRLFAIDTVRGWVMIFMALDHAMVFSYERILARREYSTGPVTPAPLLRRGAYLSRRVKWDSPNVHHRSKSVS